MRHVPASVKELGEMLNVRKLPFAPDSPAYCVRDARISFRFARRLREIYRLMGTVAKTTLPATAYNLWASRYFPGDVVEAPAEIRASARAAYHGGRTECFFIGERESVRVVDASSMFPWAMTEADFPLPWGAVRMSRELELVAVARARIESELELPVLPYRSPQGTIYPNGRWADWYTGDELRYAASCGVKIKVLQGYHFLQSVRPFDSYVGAMYKGKSSSRGPIRLLYKLMLNSLYGKFGQMGSRINVSTLAAFEKSGRSTEGVRIWNGLAIWRAEAPPPPWGNQIWAAMVTARARVRLHQMMTAVRDSGGKILYCDTDSIMYSGGNIVFPKKAAKPGDFESRGIYSEILIVGKKEYGLRSGKVWELHAKGIPEKARADYLREGTATFDRPVRLLESGRVGVQANVWRGVTKTRRVSYENRARRSDGTLRPVIVTER